MSSSVGVLGLGSFLPAHVRTNAWWSEEIVGRWRARREASVMRSIEPERRPSRAGAVFGAAMATCKQDPFEGAIERRIIDDAAEPSDLEIAAIRDLMARTGLEAGAVDALLVGSSVTDAVMSSNAVRVHRELGLPPRTLSLQTDGACNAFAQQATIAAALIQSGRARRVIGVQSNTYSRTLVADDPFSAWFGDGATAVLFGEVGAGEGVIGEAHLTDGAFFGCLDIGVPGKRWYDEGRCVMHLGSPRGAREQLFAIADAVEPMVDAALAQAGLTRADVTVLATHQPAAWFPGAVQEVLAIPQARRVDTFPWASSLAGGNIPFVLHTAQREGMLGPGDVIVTVSGATGMTMTVLALRWPAAAA